MKNLFLLTLLLLTFASCKDSNNDKDKEKIYGCMDATALNYNASANVSNGTCTYTGKVTFWYDSNGTIATVTIDGESHQITQSYPSIDPECGSVGCANFTLIPGTYSYHAESTFSTWNGTVTIGSKDCKLVLLD